MEIFNTWQFNLTGYLICVVAFYQFYKLAVSNAKQDGAATILLQLIASIAVLFLAPFFIFKFPADPKFYILLIGASIFYTLNDRLQTTARKHLQVSVFTIVNQLTTVFLILYGLTIFREQFLITKVIGAALILLANALLLYKRGKNQPSKYILVAVTATIAFATAMSIDIGISKQFNLPIYIMLTLFIPAIILLLAEKIKFAEIKAEYTGEDKKYYLLTGVFWALTIFFSLRSFQFGEVTTIVPLQATNVLLNVSVAYFALGERKDGLKKIIAALLVMFGIYLTVI